ncbi:O-antigen ligase family protein [Turicibacter sanguinis]|uniref:O-antigen ligase family protein n=1 Tax=Turicibacter sanguinis TaxID=154288 RepID=UPI0032EBDD50
MKKKYLQKIIKLLFVLNIIGIYIFSNKEDTVIFSEIILMGLIGCLFIYLIKINKINLNSYFLFMGMFVIYTWMTCLWALEIELAVEKSITLTLLFITGILMYNFFYDIQDNKFIIKSLFWAGIFLALYTIFYYGISDFFLRLAQGGRIGGEILNENSLGMYTGIAVIISFYYVWIKNKKIYYLILVIPFVVAMSTGSRKAVILIVMGIGILILCQMENKIRLKQILIIPIIIIGIALAMKSPIFYVTNQRMEALFNSITGDGKIDNSIKIRNEMIRIGSNQFKETPFLGIGMGNARLISKNELGKDAYLHNNFIELLVNGGIIGFIIYYLMYLVIIIKLLPHVKNKNDLAIITFIIIFTRIVMDYGSVSYYTKINNIYIILGFSTIDILDKNKKNKLILLIKDRNFENGK